MPNKTKTVLKRPFYTMSLEGKHAELNLYGEIVETKPVNLWTGKPIEGQFIVLQDFLADFDTIKDADSLTIHMNSVGGDAYSSIAIHNKLRALKAEKTAIVEGVAMSGGSLIICACEHTKAYANSLILWHHAWGMLFGHYNAPALHKLADEFDSIDMSQAEIYMRKTGKTLEEVQAIMDDEKHLTGRKAFEMGLIDELLDDADGDADIAVSADKQTLYVNGYQMRVAALGELPQSIKVVEAVPGNGLDKNAPDASGKEGGRTHMTLEEFRKENPEAAAALLAEAQASASAAAVQSERQRIADIDAISSLYSNEIVNAAKYGETACTAQEMAYRAAVENAKQGKAFMANAKSDYKESGASNVPAAPGGQEGDKPMTNVDRVALGKAAAARILGKKEE